MINIYNVVEDLTSTEWHHQMEELMSRVQVEVAIFAEQLKDKIEYNWLSDCHLEIINEHDEVQEDLEEVLKEILEDTYEELIQELEEAEEELLEEWWE